MSEKHAESKRKVWIFLKNFLFFKFFKLIFYSENNGVNEGAVGLDNIRLLSLDKNPLCGYDQNGLQIIDKKRRGFRKHHTRTWNCVQIIMYLFFLKR